MVKVILVPRDRKTRPNWASMAQICDRVIATLEARPDYPPELYLSPRQGLMLLVEQMVIIRRTLKMPDNTLKAVS